MNNHPIVKVKTLDDVVLHGLLAEPEQKSKTIIISIHGTAGSFYWSSYNEALSSMAVELGFSYLSTNNRGAGVYEVEAGTSYSGASLEIFEDCILDVNAWIEFVKGKGYEYVILQGHSFGTEKCVYYMNKGSYKESITGVILLGFCDSVSTQKKYENSIDKSYFAEAKRMVEDSKGDYLISDLFGLAGELPISAKTYLNFFSNESELSKVMPFGKGDELAYFRNIQVPILGIIGDNEDGEYTIIPIKEAVDLLKKENQFAEAFQIKNCNHGFEGREMELADLISIFLKEKFLQR